MLQLRHEASKEIGRKHTAKSISLHVQPSQLRQALIQHEHIAEIVVLQEQSINCWVDTTAGSTQQHLCSNVFLLPIESRFFLLGVDGNHT